jgi:hypothetical protein
MQITRNSLNRVRGPADHDLAVADRDHLKAFLPSALSDAVSEGNPRSLAPHMAAVA